MKFKLDENLGPRVAEEFGRAGHDATTVADERLHGAADQAVLRAAHAEGRCLVTLDVEFGNPIVFRPGDYSGIAVVRLPPQGARSALVAAVASLLTAAVRTQVGGKLWIVQPGRVREYQPER